MKFVYLHYINITPVQFSITLRLDFVIKLGSIDH